MSLDGDILDIREMLSRGVFNNEAAVSSGIVLRLLRALGWPTENPSVVAPEYSVGTRRVDFALCQRPQTPAVFVEVKPTNAAADTNAEKQLFEYAFHQGVPIAVLARGGRWSFYWPAGQGSYEERRIAQIDLSKDSAERCAEVLQRYLNHGEVLNNRAEHNARTDHEGARKRRDAGRFLDTAWSRLIEKPNDALVDLLCREVNAISGLTVDPSDAAEFIQKTQRGGAETPHSQSPPPRFTPPTSGLSSPPQAAAPNPPIRQSATKSIKGRIRQINFGGKVGTFRSNYESLAWLLLELEKQQPGFLQKYADNKPARMKKRAIIARNPNELFLNKPPEFVKVYSYNLGNGWHMNTNNSRDTYESFLRLACEVANLAYGRDVKVIIDD